MLKKPSYTQAIVIVLLACMLTLLLINIIGKPLEKFETKLYQNLSGKGQQLIISDPAGIPMIQYEGHLQKQYNPLTIAEQALHCSDDTDSASSKFFFNCVEWFITQQTILNDSSIIFLYHYDWPDYQMISPWRSAMCQGRAMQLFIKAYEKTGNLIYLGYAKKTMNTLFTEVKNGGVTYKDSTGYWYEEYADDNAPQSRVLNGMIVTLQGISDYYKASGNEAALYLFNQGVNDLKNCLPEYDNNGHSYYDILKTPASPWYHKFHIELLDFLYAETHDVFFKEYQDKWSAYKEPSYLASLIKNPTNIGFFSLCTLFLATLLIIYGIWIIFPNKNHS